MPRCEVLPAGSLLEGGQLQPETAHGPCTLGLADPCLLDRAPDCPAQARIDRSRPGQVLSDAGQRGLPLGAVDVRAALAREPDVKSRLAEEDNTIKPRQTPTAQRWLRRE